MAEKKPLVNSSGVVSELSGSDTIPVANYPTMVGDSGSGGTKGAVPAPASGDAAAGKFLKANGTWAAPSGSSSPLTTKGDVYTFSTVDARLAVGTDGQFLVSDSAETTGLKWVRPFTYSIIGDMDDSGRWTTATASSGTVGWNTGGLTMTTSATGGGRATASLDAVSASFDGQLDGSFSAYVGTEGTNYQLYFGVGACAAAAGSLTMTGKHIGFEFQRSGGSTTTYATNANGTTQTSTSFAGFSSGFTPFLFQFVKDGTTQIRFYLDGVLKATHTTNIPSGNAVAGALQCAITNRSTASSTVAQIIYMQYNKISLL